MEELGNGDESWRVCEAYETAINATLDDLLADGFFAEQPNKIRGVKTCVKRKRAYGLSDDDEELPSAEAERVVGWCKRLLEQLESADGAVDTECVARLERLVYRRLTK
jgi:hypothetical protein